MAQPTKLLYFDAEGPGVRDTDGPVEVANSAMFEVAVILMTNDLSREYARFETVIRPTAEALEQLHSIPFVLDMHKASGLYDILTGPDAQNLPTLEDAEDAILALLDEHLEPGEKVTISGTGVARYDKPQVQVQMPRLAAHLTYDEQDISSARKRYEQVVGMPIVPAKPVKTHRAMADIEDDIRYQKAFDNLYAGSVSEGASPDVAGSQLLALALTEQFMMHDSFLDPEGVEYYTPRPPQVMQSLLEGVPAIEVVAGYMAVTQQLLRQLASLAGVDPQSAIEGMRGALLEAYAQD